MKIAFISNYLNAPCTMFYWEALSSIDGIYLNPSQTAPDHSYDHYDIALFMTYPDDLNEMRRVKKKVPNITTGLIDPRGSHIKAYIPYADFLIVDSLEMKDFFSNFKRPIFQYYEYPKLERKVKNHFFKKKTIIAYHGNSVHLASMYPNITHAIETLSEKYDIEFWAMYNIKQQGKCKLGTPNNIPVKHIQWHQDNYYKYLAKADIGIVPNMMPIKKINKFKMKACVYKSYFNDSLDDYLIRFKMPSNPGRLIVFGMMGIPVVTDFYPSALQFIKDEQNGMLAYSMGGWHTALEKLILSPALRQKLSFNMFKTIDQYFDFDKQNLKFLSFLENIVEQEKSNNDYLREPGEDISSNYHFWKAMIIQKLHKVKNKFLQGN